MMNSLIAAVSIPVNQTGVKLYTSICRSVLCVPQREIRVCDILVFASVAKLYRSVVVQKFMPFYYYYFVYEFLSLYHNEYIKLVCKYAYKLSYAHYD